MISLNSTSLSDALSSAKTTARFSVMRIGMALLFLCIFSSQILSQVLINEVVTDPQQDWSTNGFDGTIGAGSIDSDDDWIELYITANGLNLTGWTIELIDGTDVSGTIAAGGAFTVSNYISSTGGSFTDTDAGDYIVLGELTTGAINETVTVVLRNNSATLIDQVIIASGSGTMFTGSASSVTNESVCRIPNGQDTDVEATDFVKTRATLGANNSPTGVVLINEVVTNPRTDWSTNGFDGTDGGSTISAVDEWIELYIGTADLNLTKWTFTIDDSNGSFSGDLTSTGAFDVVNYIGSGDFTQTTIGDYVVLGNPDGSNDMNTNVYIRLFDAEGTLIDDVEIGDNEEGDAVDDGAPNSLGSTVANESVARISNASDTDVDAVDFQGVVSTLGTQNGLMNVFVDAAAADDTGLGTVGDPKQLIQSGINLVLSTGTVTVVGGDYSENLTISKSLTLNGANQGTAGNGTRATESRIDPGSLSTAMTITANDVTVDGFQIGTDASTSNASEGINATVSGGITISNNIVHANSRGVSVVGSASGTVDVSANHVSMLAVEDVNNIGTGSIGIILASISGDADANVTSNDISNAGIGISTYALTSSVEAVIDGGTYTGCMLGILPGNFDGIGGFSASTLTIQNLTMSGFVTDVTVTSPDTEAGIYVVSAGGAAADDLTITIDNVDISGVGNGASNNSGIIIGDFPDASNGAGIDATITNSNIHDNENRGIYSTGADAVTSVTQCTITGNGFDPHGSGSLGYSIIARDDATINVSNCTIANASSQTNLSTEGIHVSSDPTPGDGVITVTNSTLSSNGNGTIAGQSGINLSGNYFSTTDEATILSLVGSGNDFTPWLASGTDTDLVTNGFQGDFSDLIVGVSGAQTGASGRIEEGISLTDAGGTVTVNAGTYPESLTIAKSLTLNGANQGTAGSGTRVTETIIEPASANVGMTIGATDITIDGFQFGTDNANSNHTTAISNTGFTGFTGNNNRIFANSSGVLIIGISSGAVSLSSNYVEMLGLANPLVATSASIGLGMINVSGTADVDFIDNDINTATYGIATFGLTSSTISEINGGSYSGCTIGISSSNFDGSASFSASTLNISNVTMAGFAGPDGGITGASGIPQAGIYAFTTASAPSTAHDLTISVDTADISGVGNGATDYAGILAADFFDTDPALEVTDDKGISLTVSNSNIHDNTNRGVHSRGADAVVNINTSTIASNTNAGGVVFAKGTLNINNSFIVLPSSGATSGLLAQTGGQITANSSNFDLNGNVDGSTLIANIQDPADDETINVSGSWLTSTDETTILSLLDESDTDFSPWLTSSTDTDGTALGFQPDLSGLNVGTGGSQAGGLLTEAHDLLDADGTINVNAATYAETLTVSKNISIVPASGTSIDDVVLNGGNLNVMGNTITVNTSLTMTNGVFDIDQEDSDKSDDPVFILPTTVNGSSYDDNTHFEGRIEASVTGASSFTFEVGDEGAYRPATLTPTTTTTFQVAHIAEATPVGGGATNPDIINLIGDAGNPSGTIESVLNFRYWDIDVTAAGPPGVTNVALQISSGDNATDPTFLGMTRFDGADWVVLSLATPSSGSDPYIITGQTSSFSEFSIYSTSSTANPLPVELIDFVGSKDGGDVQLKWSTLTEINSHYFEIERSRDGVAFDPIGRVSSNGNSNQRRDYRFLDNQVKSGVYYYRLKMVDVDGSFEYSSVILIAPDLSDARIVMYPNPASDYIQMEGIEASHVRQLTFYDLSGKIHKMITSLETPSIQIADIPQGHYLLKLEMVDGSVFEGKVLKK
ncbi:MAG: T9SS type A sorting domain-containing protein [Ekhidna sp.]